MSKEQSVQLKNTPGEGGVQGRTPQKPHTNRTDHQAHQNKLDPINLREIREVIRQVYRVGGVSLVNGILVLLIFRPNLRVLATFHQCLR